MRYPIRSSLVLCAAAALLTFSGCAVAPGPSPAGTSPTSPAPIQTTGHNQWTWVSGSNLAGQAGVYGTQGEGSAQNVPGARMGSVSWTDSEGNLWLFGGAGATAEGMCVPNTGLCSAGTNAYYDDLWKFSGGQWTWVAGASGTDQPGVYGMLGVAAPADTPGARYGAVSWKDASGGLWLFGGTGYDAAGTAGYLSDLWRYSNGQWTWMGGPSAANQMGVYGTQGAPAAGDMPGGRTGALSFTDASGNLWLFGGQGCAGFCGAYMDDLWEYTGGQWIWVSGLDVYYPAQPGIYGTQGVPAATSRPGGRGNASGWTDASGNFWVFGGVGWGSVADNVSELNDLWEYSKGEWAWVSGPSQTYPEVDLPGTYGIEGVAATSNVPGSRDGALSWTDAQGDLWLFGGEGFASNSQGGPYLNDLWKFSGGQWTWVSGSNLGGQAGVYGTLGIGSAGNVAGARMGAVGWSDAAGDLWLFGGVGRDASTGGYLNDLWEYQP